MAAENDGAGLLIAHGKAAEKKVRMSPAPATFLVRNAVSVVFHTTALGSSRVVKTSEETPLVFTSVQRAIALPKSAGVRTVVGLAPVRLPQVESVSRLVESQVFGPQLGMGLVKLITPMVCTKQA